MHSDAARPKSPPSHPKELRLAELLAPTDAQTAERWRASSSAEHAEAMILLAEYAERVAAATGFGREVETKNPGFPAAGPWAG